MATYQKFLVMICTHTALSMVYCMHYTVSIDTYTCGSRAMALSSDRVFHVRLML